MLQEKKEKPRKLSRSHDNKNLLNKKQETRLPFFFFYTLVLKNFHFNNYTIPFSPRRLRKV